MQDFAPKIEVMRTTVGDIISAEDSTMRYRPSLLQKWKEHYNSPIYNAPRSNFLETGCIIYFLANVIGIFYVTIKTYEGDHYYLVLTLQFYLMIQTFTSWVKVRKEAKNNVCDETISRNKGIVNENKDRRLSPFINAISVINSINIFIYKDVPDDIVILLCEADSSISTNYATEGHRDPDTPNPMLWKFCEICNLDVPPRSHHCKVCQVCVLKRGHHCYLTDVCVGFHNQRHFMKMCLFSILYGGMGLSIAYDYLSTSDEGEWFDYILPVAFFRFFAGYLELHRLMAVLTSCYTLWWTVPISAGLLTSHVISMMEGRTQHESKYDSPVQTRVTRTQRLRAVLGDNWGRGLLLPGNRGWQPLGGDGVGWSDLVVQYSIARTSLPVYANTRPETMSMDHI